MKHEFGETSKGLEGTRVFRREFQLILASPRRQSTRIFTPSTFDAPQHRGEGEEGYAGMKVAQRGRNGFHTPYESDNWDTLSLRFTGCIEDGWRSRIEGGEGKERMMVEYERGRGNNITLIDGEVARSLGLR
ncbi:unnamed protein product [Lasius platythorax]|uniref:Uncharacterized protein n=1 Tax=Lasius platythorax TaxID=488582 RepID=A0AAV2NET9_9HYME